MSFTGKMTTSKKTIALILAVFMMISLFVPMSSAFAADWKTGEYGGTGTEFQGGEISVKVTVNSDGAIESIEQTEADAKNNWWTEDAANTLFTKVVEKQSTSFTDEEIDAITSATTSAKGALAAVDNALSKAISGFAGGSGETDDPYIISSEAGLKYLQAQVAAGESYAGKYIKLTKDIELTDEWKPIGSSATLAFAGNFDGAGHTIDGLTITDSTLGYAGLFGYTLNGVVIKNVKLTNVDINMPDAAQNVYAGSLVAFIKNDTSGTASSVIDNCFAGGEINVKNADKITVVGGLTGFTDQRAAITNSGADVDITADSGTGRATVGVGEYQNIIHERLCFGRRDCSDRVR